MPSESVWEFWINKWMAEQVGASYFGGQFDRETEREIALENIARAAASLKGSDKTEAEAA